MRYAPGGGAAGGLSADVGRGAAEAHGHRHIRHLHTTHAHIRYVADSGGGAPAGVPSSPTFSAIVVDANSGRTIYAADPDGLRHPASITKVMTLYLLFEQLESGKMTLQSRIPISEHAAAQEPSKLGLDPGETISVEDAIKAVVTRSANDIAVAIAEAIGGDESSFAAMMTRKAHALGMASTTYRNASGLPNDNQITTARDLTILARSLEDRFPRYFRYFSTEEFEYDGQTIGNHNHLLGRVDGVDGIKTGYTRASGFNLLTSVHRDGRSLIAVVMGGHSAAGRDRVMESLIDDHLAQCSTCPHRNAGRRRLGRRGSARQSCRRPHGAGPANADPGRRAVACRGRPGARGRRRRRRGRRPADDQRFGGPEGQLALRPGCSAPATACERRTSGGRRAGLKRPSPGKGSRIRSEPAYLDQRSRPGHAGAASQAQRRRRPRRRDSAGALAADNSDHEDPKAIGKDWIIQLGATDDPAKAHALLDKALRQGRAPLAGAKPVTEKVRSADGTLYRARFAGLEQASAETACRSLKRSGFACFAARD